MRRRAFCAITSLGLLAGCLRLEDDGNGDEGDEVGDDGDEPSDDGIEPGGDDPDVDRIDPDADAVALAEAWTRGGLSANGVVADHGSFVSSFSSAAVDEVDTYRIERLDRDGETVWRSGEVDDGDVVALSSTEEIVATDDAVVVAGDGQDAARLYAFDPDSGARKWVHKTDADRDETHIRALAAAGDRVYYGVTDSGGTDQDQNPAVRALDLDTGDELWAELFDAGFFSGATVHDGRLYVGGTRTLYTFDAESGTLLDERAASIGFDGFLRVDDRLYLCGGELEVYDLENDERGWVRDLDQSLDSMVSFHDGRLYGGTRTGWVLAYDGDDGDQLWEARIDGGVQSVLAPGDGLVWVTNDDGDVYALHGDTGTVLYDRSDHDSGVAALAGLVVLDDTAYEPVVSDADD